MSETRNQILDLAEELIRSKGYAGFSYADISGPLNIKNAAIHYHFPSKAGLGLAMVQRTREMFQEQSTKWNALNPAKRLEKFMGIYRKSKKQNLVCFMGALGPVYDTLPAKMQAELRDAAAEIRTWLTGVLTEGQETDVFDFPESPSEKADLIVSALLSALILNKVLGENMLDSISQTLLQTT